MKVRTEADLRDLQLSKEDILFINNANRVFMSGVNSAKYAIGYNNLVFAAQIVRQHHINMYTAVGIFE